MAAYDHHPPYQQSARPYYHDEPQYNGQDQAQDAYGYDYDGYNDYNGYQDGYQDPNYAYAPQPGPRARPMDQRGGYGGMNARGRAPPPPPQQQQQQDYGYDNRAGPPRDPRRQMAPRGRRPSEAAGGRRPSEASRGGYPPRMPPSGRSRSHSRPPQHGQGEYTDSGRPPRPDYGPGNGGSYSHGASGGQHRQRPERQPLVRAASPEVTSFDNPFPVFPMKRGPPKPQTAPVEDGMAALSFQSGRPSGELSRPPGARKMSKSSQSSGTPRPSMDQPSHERPMPDHQWTGGARPFSPRQEQARGGSAAGHGPPPQAYGARQAPRRAQTAMGAGGYSLPAVAPRPAFVPQAVQRSKTMPQNVPEDMMADHSPWAEPGPTAGYHGPDSPNFIPPRPMTAGEDRERGDSRAPHTQPYNQAYIPPRYPAADKHESFGAIYDNYYRPESNDHLSREAAIEADMPDFDNEGPPAPIHRRGNSIDKHLNSPSRSAFPTGGPQAQAAELYEDRGRPNFSHQAHRSRSQPDFRRGQNGANGYIAEMPADVPDMPQLPRNDTGSQGYMLYGQAAPPGPDYNPGTPVQAPRGPPQPRYYLGNGNPQDQMQRAYTDMSQNSDPGARFNGPPSHPLPDHRARGPPRGGAMIHPTALPINGQPMSPGLPQPRHSEDSLPPHPTPVRAGLMEQHAPSPQNSKPPPVRNYNANPSPVQGGGPVAPPDASAPIKREKRRGSDPITPDELNKLRAAAKSKTSDSALQLRLAKKLVEAGSILSDEGGRADAKTKAKNREKYHLEAYKIVKKLVSHNSAEAMFYLADAGYGGGAFGLVPDTKEAFSLYQSAAKLGHSPSAYRTAVCCEMGAEEGGGTRRDPGKAVQWYKRAASLGDVAAMYKMGMILLKGLLNQQKNMSEAITWLKRAADRADEENPHALHELGLLYEQKTTSRDNEKVVKDEQYALSLFTRAAKLGYKFSQFRLGEAYEYGLLGCPVSARESILWYTRAAAQGEHQSELALSGWYLTGSEGILEQSDTEAYLWARKAACADPPLPKAMFAMGYFTEVGIGCPRALEEAKKWYGRAASYKFPKAQERLEELKKGGVKVQRNREMLSRSDQKQHEENCVVM